MGRYDDLGIRRVVNAAATLTRLGGSVMPPPVVAAMAEGAAMHVDLPLLQERVGERIAALTHNEACYISSGAAAGIAITVAACIAGEDPAAIARFPYLTDGKCEVIIHRAHRNGYDHAARQTGATLVEIGGAHITHAWELETAISPRTACVLWFAGEHYARGALPLADVVAIAHAHGVPVLVDAAAQIPPISSLWHFTRELGADIAIFSGGKGLRGPQSSGLVLGRRDIVAACRVNGSPNHSLGRPMKVGKEEIGGLIVALRRFLARDHAAERAEQERRLVTILAAVEGMRGVRVEQLGEQDAPRAYPTGVIRIDEGVVEKSVATIINELIEGDPPVAVTQNFLHERGIGIVTALLKPGEEEIVAQRLRAVLG